jgi:hypothetical protein
MKKKTLLLSSLAALAFSLAGCDSAEEKGRQAAAEFCDCIKTNSVSDCETQINKNYSLFTNDDNFYSSFNSSNTCNATIYKKEI